MLFCCSCNNTDTPLIMINYLLSRYACRGFTVLIKGVKTLDFMGHLYLVK
jgi:hypothetical protein